MLSEIVQKTKNYAKEEMKDNYLKWFVYHNWDHVLDVYERTKYLSKKENINDDLSEMLYIAVFFHDIGYIKDIQNHEYISAKTAEEFLEKHNYPKDKIDIIKSIILATKIAKQPQNHLQKVIKDADIDNMWRKDFFEKWKLLKKEIETINWKEIDTQSWNESTYSLLLNIEFYTETQIFERQKQLKENIAKLQKEIWKK